MKVEFELTDESIARLTALAVKMGVHTVKDVFENSLALLVWAVEEIEGGRVIASVDEEKELFKQMEMPIFESIRNQG